MTRQEELQELTEQLEDDPIKPGDPRYFDFYGARGRPRGADPIESL